MKKMLVLAISVLSILAATQLGLTATASHKLDIADVEKIIKDLVPEVKNLQVVPAKDLEPNPQGKYRRYAFIQGDFNGDAQEDIAICATDDWDRKSLTRNSYVLIASKTKTGSWVRVFFTKFERLASPFLIWDKERLRLLVGANHSDYEPGDIVWDLKEKKYKLLPAKD